MPSIQGSRPMMPMAPMQRNMGQPMIQNRGAAPISKPQMNAETRALMARAGGGHKASVGTMPPFCMGPDPIAQAVQQAQSGKMNSKDMSTGKKLALRAARAGMTMLEAL